MEVVDAKPAEPVVETPATPTFDAATVIRQAYLRTLNRLPEQAEVDRAKQFIDDASSPQAGLRGLLWALVNTKEFIVNH